MKRFIKEIGANIKEIREVEKNFKRAYVAERLSISERAYSNIENNVSDLTVSRLEEISIIFECSPLYILNYKSAKKDFYNYFHNYDGNNGVNIMNQGVPGSQNDSSARIIKLQEELLESERKRINLLEKLLSNNNIDF